MPIRVEFYGIARQRAGVGQTEVGLDRPSVPLGDVLREVGRRFPALADECLEGDRPRRGYIVNLGGERFVTQPTTTVWDGECVLLLSADGGG